MKERRLVSTTFFYDSIAIDYDMHLNNEKDILVRKDVEDYFKKNVMVGSVLDFGGGTGLDLPWLTEAGYTVYFCEPAENMKSQAIKLAEEYPEDRKPVFLPTQDTDFHLWSLTYSPIKNKLSAVLANFGVINYVQDMELLFEKFHMLLQDDGVLILNLLFANKAKLYTRYLKNVIKSLVNREKIKTGSSHEGLTHETTLYSVKDIRQASYKYFELMEQKLLGNHSDFLLLHLKKR